jgi:hypothetical protein
MAQGFLLGRTFLHHAVMQATAGRLSTAATGGKRSLAGILPNSLAGILPSSLGSILPNSLCGILPDSLCGIVPSSLSSILPNSLSSIVPSSLGSIVPGTLGGIQPNSLSGILPDSLRGILPNSVGGIQPDNLPDNPGSGRGGSVSAPLARFLHLFCKKTGVHGRLLVRRKCVKTEEAVLASQTRLMLSQAQALTSGQGKD